MCRISRWPDRRPKSPSPFRRVCVLALVMFTWSLIPAPDAVACSCAPTTVPELVENADAVFLGEVTAIGPAGDVWHRQVNFHILQSWKGVTGTEVGVFTGIGGGDCGAGAPVGERLLVYGFASGSELYMSICSTTGSEQDIKSDMADLAALGVEPTSLANGPDPQWAPQPVSPCGLGFLPFALLAAVGLAAFRGRVGR